MPEFPSQVVRSIGGLASGSGRTLVIAGPPLSGKSELLADLRAELAARPVRLIELRGTYRDRTTPYATFATVEEHTPTEPAGEEAGLAPALPPEAPPEAEGAAAPLDLAL